MLKNLFLFFTSLILTILFIEIILNFFPVTSITRTKPLFSYSEPFEVSSDKLSKKKFSLYTWDMKKPIARYTNNYGFFSNFNYEKNFEGIFVVGDSYVEAVQVAFEDTFHQVLSKKINKKIYNIAISGAPLSQYEAYVSQICREFKPQKIIISIVENDFIESLYENRARAGFFHYHKNGKLLPTYYNVSSFRKIANKSSLIKYLYFHLHINSKLVYIMKYFFDKTNYGLHVSGSLESKISSANIFLRNMKNYCLDPENIVFVIDANRIHDSNNIYSNKPLQIDILKYFESQARKNGYNVVSLHYSMQEHYKRNGLKFEFLNDGHWNEFGHKIVADTVLSSIIK